MIKFLFRTAFYTVVGVLLLHGAHTLYVRYRDQNFDPETEARAARHFAEKSSEWVKDMLEEQRLKLAERQGNRPVPVAKTNAPVVLDDLDTPIVEAEMPEPVGDPMAHNKRNRRIFRDTVRTLSETESVLNVEGRK